MNSTNSKNLTFLILLFFVVLVIFGYVFISNDFGNNVSVNIRDAEIEE